MRTAVFTILVMLTYALPVQATVYEFNSDGSMVKHEAFDYRSPHGGRQYEVTVDRYGGIPPYAETKAYVRKIERTLKAASKD